ncbi:MAG TPA: 5-formyltetrahydrofolate cyclo-ligase [Caulobacteraceae bacterium]|nr:5-formyltetrahydrofolate cyclo-ligase [Caulobacteraceae bacterium]
MTSEKADLRAQLRLRRRELALTHLHAAERAALHLPLERLGRVMVAAGYHAIGGELDPWPALRRLSEAGARIALPVAVSPHAPLRFHLFEPGDVLEPDASRTPAPLPSAPLVTPDLLLMPLLGFDRRGYRLGQGGGYYDRTLQALRGAGPVWAVGLAYAGQALDAVPHDGHDQPLDAILTETGYHVVQA